MSKNKSEQIPKLQEELKTLLATVSVEQDEKKKKKILARIDKLRREINRIKSGKLLSKETKRDLIAYSFIAPNFIGFCVFTLVPIVFAFALAFLNWDGSNPIEWAGFSNFVRMKDDIFFQAALKNTIIYIYINR